MDIAEVLETKGKLEPLLQKEFGNLATLRLSPSGRIRVDLHQKDILAKVADVLLRVDADTDVRVVDWENIDPELSRAYDSGLLSDPVYSWYDHIKAANSNIIGLSYNPYQVRVTVRNLLQFYDEPHLRRNIPDTLILTLSTGKQVALPVVIEEERRQ